MINGRLLSLFGPNHGYLKAACTLRHLLMHDHWGPNHGYLKAACT